jgi:hypothetical protein
VAGGRGREARGRTEGAQGEAAIAQEATLVSRAWCPQEAQMVYAELIPLCSPLAQDEGEKSEEGGPVSAPPRNVFSALTLEDEDD